MSSCCGRVKLFCLCRTILQCALIIRMDDKEDHSNDQTRRINCMDVVIKEKHRLNNIYMYIYFFKNINTTSKYLNIFNLTSYYLCIVFWGPLEKMINLFYVYLRNVSCKRDYRIIKMLHLKW